MYAVFHPDLEIQPWHIYVAFILITWFCCAIVVFGNRLLPVLNDIGLFLIIGGGLITIIVVAAMPKVHASNSAVWGNFHQNNAAGWSDGVTFLTGVLNGAFTIGTPDAVTHMSEELPNPARDMPKAVAAQMILGTLSKTIALGFECRIVLKLTPNSLIFLCCRNHVWNHGYIGSCYEQWLFPTGCGLLSSHWQQGCDFWSALDSLPFHHDLCTWNIPHRK